MRRALRHPRRAGAGPRRCRGCRARNPGRGTEELVQALGGPFIVFRAKVQEELRLSDEQQHKLLEKLPGHVRETMHVFEKARDLKPEERERAMQEHRRKSDEKLSAVLKDVLDSRQQ